MGENTSWINKFVFLPKPHYAGLPFEVNPGKK